MIRHIVMWKLKDEVNGKTKTENALKIKELLEALPPQISEIKAFEVGVNVNKGDAAFDACLISTFESLEDLEKYRTNPKHVKVSEFVKSVRTDRKVVDFEF